VAGGAACCAEASDDAAGLSGALMEVALFAAACAGCPPSSFMAACIPRNPLLTCNTESMHLVPVSRPIRGDVVLMLCAEQRSCC
jgi:hypothetical protein